MFIFLFTKCTYTPKNIVFYNKPEIHPINLPNHARPRRLAFERKYLKYKIKYLKDKKDNNVLKYKFKYKKYKKLKDLNNTY